MKTTDNTELIQALNLLRKHVTALPIAGKGSKSENYSLHLAFQVVMRELEAYEND